MASNNEIEKKHAPTSPIFVIPCTVCGDKSSGEHYNTYACDSCAGFFKRSIHRNRHYVCKAKSKNMCVIDRTRINECRACRLAKCHEAGMKRDAIQQEGVLKNSMIKRQKRFVDSLNSSMHVSQLPQMSMVTHPMNPGPINFGFSPGFIYNLIFPFNTPWLPIPIYRRFYP